MTNQIQKFKLSESFIEKYKNKKPPFPNILSYLVYNRTYARPKPDGTNEKWYETVERVINGTYNMQKELVDKHGLNWQSSKAQKSAQEMYDRIFHLKFTPPGRGLWSMGSPIIEEKGLVASLNNCAFISTKNIDQDPSKPFCFLMDMSMLGVGVGFDLLGAGKIIVKGPDLRRKDDIYEVPDSREGWVESLKRLLESYFYGLSPIKFNYSLIRPEGSPIKVFGGKSSGYKPLEQLHIDIAKILNKEINEPISERAIIDIMNIIARCVVSGNVRRSATIVLGDNKEEYLDLKNYIKNKYREGWGWASNNSINAKIGMDYTEVSERIKHNGEPGIIWMDNVRGYSRMKDPIDNKDYRADGVNPCAEQSLESGELCTLVETFPSRHENIDDYLRTLKFAYLYAKTVTLGKTHWKDTNAIMLRNRRIGCSMSGIASFLAKRTLTELKEWMERGYQEIKRWDKIYSEWLCIPESIKCTSIKPSGSVSLLAGVTPGIHFPESRYYIRRVRLAKNSELIPLLESGGYHIEPDITNPDHTLVVEIPIDIGEGVKTLKDVTIWEQMNMAAFAQRYWADNQVSCTITFNPEKEGHQIKDALDYYQYQLKGISFLPRKKEVYKQMPYEEITEEQYIKMTKDLKKISFDKTIHNEEIDTEAEKYCNGGKCDISLKLTKKE